MRNALPVNGDGNPAGVVAKGIHWVPVTGCTKKRVAPLLLPMLWLWAGSSLAAMVCVSLP